jgi:hypothetical protein
MRYYPFGSGSQTYFPATASFAAYAIDTQHYITVVSASYAVQGPSGSQGPSGVCVQQSGSQGPQGPSGSQGPIGIIGIPGANL